MEDTNTTTENNTSSTVVGNSEATAVNKAPSRFPSRGKFATGDQKSFGSRGANSSGPRRSGPRPDSEFDQKTLLARRVTRVVAGGRRFSLAVLVALGDKKGKIGLGVGKAVDTALAINKATRDAKKNMFKISLTKDLSLPHDVHSKYSTSKVYLFPNKSKGLVAGSAVREILVLAGIKNVTAKILSGSKNKMNIAKATMEALSVFGKPVINVKRSKVSEVKEDK